MLIMAGLLGIIGAGAASMVAVQPQTEDNDVLDDTDEEALQDDLLDNLEGIHPVAEAEPEDPMAGTLHAGLLEDAMFLPGDEQDLPFDQGASEDVNADILEPQDQPSAFAVPAFAGPEFASFMTGDWISQANGPEVIDYEAAKESILVVWDDTSLDADEPSLSVTPDPDDPEVMQVNMNGKVLADVYGDSELSVSDLILMPLSSALMVGLSPA